MLVISHFNSKADARLNALILQNRMEYIIQHGYDYVSEIGHPNPDYHRSLRQVELLLKVLKDERYKKFDLVASTGQRNIVTNMFIDIRDKANKYLKPESAMVLQSWKINKDKVQMPFDMALAFE